MQTSGTSNSGRPRSLKAAFEMGAENGSVDAYIREFLDEFYAEPKADIRQSMLDVEPPRSQNPRSNAYFAAVAEHLALKYGLKIPDWAFDPNRFLDIPFFPCGLESLKATLLKESPTAFRRRLIFVDADPLFRPRREKLGMG